MANQEDEARLSPATVSSAYATMLPRWEKMEALLGGTEAMRAAGETYLPKHPEENASRYNERLSTASLLNITELTLDSLVGRPFSDDIQLNDDIPEKVKNILDDVDLQGNKLTVFARQLFKEGVAKGFAHILIEFPRKEQPEDGQARTLADDRQENLRPYWVFIKPENLIFAHTKVINGVETVVHARILEETTFMDGFAEVTQTRIRVLEPGFQEIFEKKIDPKTKKEVWVSTDSFSVDLDFIPLVTFYAEKDDAFLAKPPLMDLADLNITHWQSGSDQRAILTAARFPILAMSGGTDDEGDIIVGPYNFLHTTDPQGKFYYVEHNGRAIESGRKDLLDLEEQMAHYGAEFLTKRPGRETATARALDSAEATSPLQDMTIRFVDALNQALFVTAQWLKEDEGGTVKMTTDFGPENPDQSDMNILKFTRRLGDISRKAYLEEQKRRGILSEEYDIEEDLNQIQKEVLLGVSKFMADDEEDTGPGESEVDEGSTGKDEPSGGGISG